MCEIGTLTGHTPGCGPRWVAYGNEVLSPRTGLYLGGQNENFICVYNRFWVCKIIFIHTHLTLENIQTE